MFKSRVALVAFAAALLGIFAAPAANATYAPPVFSAEVPTGIQPGDEITVVFHSNVSCQQWTFQTFQGQNAPAGSGTDYPVTLTAPGDGTYTLTAFCTWDPAASAPISAPISDPSAVTPAVFTSSSSSDTLLAAPQTDPVTAQIVVGDSTAGDNAADDEGDENGALPDTGGSNLSLLAIGAGLVVVGAGVTVAARRRKNS
jgi:LPXTG-motif cell wall-anchored protein